MIKNIFHVFVSNGIGFLISALVTFVAPKVLGVSSYGYFQLYIFYTSYITCLHFGWADGLFLKLGGSYYDKLDKNALRKQVWLYNLWSGLLSVILFSVVLCMNNEFGKEVVLLFSCVNLLITLPRTLFQIILQSTNRIREYATLLMLEKIVYLAGAVLCFVARGSFVWLILADLAGKGVSCIYSFVQCRDLLVLLPKDLQGAFGEIADNIKVGVKLTISNFSSMLINGVVRFSIEKTWDVETFGRVSLTMSVSNLLMLFIRAVALTMFPILRRTEEEQLSEIYTTMRTCLMVPLLGMLVFYYPARVILSAWLPQYADSLVYMALLFPMCVFESKMSMLIETYMKTLRKEKWLLLVNVTTVSLSVVITLITTYWLHNLDLAVASIVFLLAFRCVFAELLLSTVLDVNVKTDIVLELALTIIFIGASWFVGGIAGLAIYAVAYLIYLFIKRNDVAFVLNTALRMVRRA